MGTEPEKHYNVWGAIWAIVAAVFALAFMFKAIEVNELQGKLALTEQFVTSEHAFAEKLAKELDESNYKVYLLEGDLDVCKDSLDAIDHSKDGFTLLEGK